MSIYKSFIQYFRLYEAKKPSKAESSKVSSDDKGKLHELLLAKHLHPNNTLPEHHRSESKNPDHAGTPQQVHDKLKQKIGDAAYNEIDSHAKSTAAAVKKHLETHGHIGGNTGHSVANVHWTSNRDTEKKQGDHEKTTGIKDVNSNADLILTTANKKTGKVKHVGVSAKYGSQSPNYANPGLAALEKQAGHEPGTYSSLMKAHEDRMEKLGYSGSKKERHEKFKQDKASDNSADKARAAAAEKSSLETRQQIARMHEQGLSNKTDAELRHHIANAVSPPTKIAHIVAHSKVDSSGGSTPHVEAAENIAKKHLDNFEHGSLQIKKGNGISTDIVGRNKKTGKMQKVMTQIVKGVSGPHKGFAAATKIG